VTLVLKKDFLTQRSPTEDTKITKELQTRWKRLIEKRGGGIDVSVGSEKNLLKPF
jgi:hypothetical protein